MNILYGNTFFFVWEREAEYIKKKLTVKSPRTVYSFKKANMNGIRTLLDQCKMILVKQRKIVTFSKSY